MLVAPTVIILYYKLFKLDLPKSDEEIQKNNHNHWGDIKRHIWWEKLTNRTTSKVRCLSNHHCPLLITKLRKIAQNHINNDHKNV